MARVPAIRFSEFNGEWEENKLGDIADITKLAGFEFTKHIVYSDIGKVIALRALNIKNNSLNLNEVKYIDKSDFSKLSRSKLFIDDLMFTYVGTIGETAIIKEDNRFYLAPNVCRIRLIKDYHLITFINQYFNTNKYKKTEINKYIATSSQPALSMTNIRLFNLNLPQKKEQEKIASFLSAIDKKIEKLNEKIELQKHYKKAMMQKLFSQEIRFKDENGLDFSDWEEKKLKELSEHITKGTTPKKFVKTGISFVKIEGIFNLKIKKEKCLFIDEDVHNKELKRSILKDKDILFAIAGSLGKVALVTEDILPANTNQALSIVRLKDERYIKYVLYILQSSLMKKYICKNLSIGAQPNLSLEQVGNFNFDIPSLKEQQKIANFLSSLDTKIEAVEKEKQKAQEFKKGLLQQMFV